MTNNCSGSYKDSTMQPMRQSRKLSIILIVELQFYQMQLFSNFCEWQKCIIWDGVLHRNKHNVQILHTYGTFLFILCLNVKSISSSLLEWASCKLLIASTKSNLREFRGIREDSFLIHHHFTAVPHSTHISAEAKV